MRTFPHCVLESVTVIPFTARLKVFCGGAITKSDFSEELLFAFDDEEDFAEDEDSALLDELCFSEELEGGATELEDSTLLEEESSEELDVITELLLLRTCDELDSTEDDETDEDDSALELLDSELLENPYFE